MLIHTGTPPDGIALWVTMKNSYPSIVVRPWHLEKHLTDTELAPSKVVLSIIYTSIDDIVIMCAQTIAEHTMSVFVW